MKMTNQLLGLVLLALGWQAQAAVSVVPTMDGNALKAALNPQGLTITAVTTPYGTAGQFGTYSNFTLSPVTISNGVLLSSGNVASVGLPPDPGDKPSQDWVGDSSPEFDAYGPGNIENFTSSYDVAVLRVTFNLTTNSQVKFDFVFGSVEFPNYTSAYTDALLVFLDGTDPTNQIAFDQSHQPVQVGLAFSGVVETGDRNTTFAAPHGLMGRLTTTTAVLPAGNHTLRFEVGDVNDGILDSAAFIANLRAEAGTQGTVLAPRPPPLVVNSSQFQAGTNRTTLTWTNNLVTVLLESSGQVTGVWNTVTGPRTTNLNWVLTTVTNNAPAQFFRLRQD